MGERVQDIFDFVISDWKFEEGVQIFKPPDVSDLILADVKFFKVFHVNDSFEFS